MSKRPSLSKSSAKFTRRVGTRELLQRFLIVCEGEKTEPNYFRAFRQALGTAVDVAVEGLGYNTLSLVREAMKLKDPNKYDQVWCVFDRDSFPAQNFNEAIKLAERSGIKPAYSNEAFELWYVLHFAYMSQALDRSRYIEILSENQNLGARYQKNSVSMYKELESKQLDAIRNAEHLLATHDHRSPANENPSTTVHLLVQELNKFRRP